jgi:hypothetical protein
VDSLNVKQFVLLQAFGLLGVLMGVWLIRCMDIRALK